MAAPGTPINYNVQTANIQNLLSWDIAVGATAYTVQRSTDGVSYSVLTSVLVTNWYLDTSVSAGTQYWYKIAASSASGTSPYTSPQSVIPAPTAELALGTLRLLSQMKADRVGSNFVTLPEWNSFINLAMYELYDLLIGQEPDAFMAPRARFTTNGAFQYALPNGVASFTNQSNQNFVPAAFYKLLGVDLSVNTANNAFVTLNKYNLIDRNRFIYPNSTSTIYGVNNMRYRLLGNNIEFTPTPSSGQLIQLLYIPRLTELLKDTDLTTLGYSGWLQYVIVRAAKYALDKEESDTSKLDSELLFLKGRIEESSMNRDQGQPDTISDTRASDWGGGFGWNGPSGGM